MTWQDSIASAMASVRRMLGLPQKDIQQVLLQDKDLSQQLEENDEITINFPEYDDMLQQPSNLDLFTVSQDKGENVLTNTFPPLSPDNRSSFIFQAMNFHFVFLVSVVLSQHPGSHRQGIGRMNTKELERIKNTWRK